MKNFILLIIICFSIVQLKAQNVGQEGDSLVNYVDINGLKQGVWKKYFENGNPQYEAYFVDDKPVGDLKRYDKDGFLAAHLIYEKDGKHARATFYHSNGKPAGIGNYIEKNKDSIWNYFDEVGVLYLQESFKNGIKHGAFRQYTSEKVMIEETHWKDGIKDGSWKKFYVSGEPMWEATYVNGKLEGVTKAYFISGKIFKEGVFKNDLMDGVWKRYNENGLVEKIYHFDNGVSPEAEAEKDVLLKETIENKGKYDDPRDPNDIDWLRGINR